MPLTRNNFSCSFYANFGCLFNINISESRFREVNYQNHFQDDQIHFKDNPIQDKPMETFKEELKFSKLVDFFGITACKTFYP